MKFCLSIYEKVKGFVTRIVTQINNKNMYTIIDIENNVARIENEINYLSSVFSDEEIKVNEKLVRILNDALIYCKKRKEYLKYSEMVVNAYICINNEEEKGNQINIPENYNPFIKLKDTIENDNFININISFCCNLFS